MTGTSDGVGVYISTATTTLVQPPRTVVKCRPFKRFVPRKIKRDFVDDWIGEISAAYFSVRGDAPPKRLRAKKARLVRALRTTLKLAQSYQSAPPEDQP